MNRRKYLSLGAAAAVLVLGAWYVGFWSPRTGELARTRAATAAATAKVDGLSGQLAVLRAQHKNLPAERSELAAALDAVPSGEQVDQAIDQIALAASASGVTWQNESQAQPSSTTTAATPSTKPAARGAGAAPTSVVMTLSVSGSYERTVAFINALNAMPRLFAVDTVTFGGSQSAVTQITGRLFYDPTPLPAPPPQRASAVSRG